MHKNRLQLGLRPGPSGELAALPRPLSGSKGLTSKAEERREGKGGENKKRESREREGSLNPHFYDEVFAYDCNITFWTEYTCKSNEEEMGVAQEGRSPIKSSDRDKRYG